MIYTGVCGISSEPVDLQVASNDFIHSYQDLVSCISREGITTRNNFVLVIQHLLIFAVDIYT